LIKALKNIPIIVGGPGPTLEPEVYLNSGAGEVYRGAFGEGAVHDILTGNSASNETMPRDILNAIPPPDYDFRGGGHFRLTQEGLIPIDTAEKSIPFIRNLGTIQDEKFGNRTCDGLTLTVISQRGCASFCDYCNNSTLKKIHGGSFRRERSIELVIEEICSAQDIHNGKISYVMIFDDDFFLRTMKDMRTFNRLWKAHVRLPFFVFGTPSAFSEEKLELLAGAGLNRLGLGFQSGSRSLCTKLGRRFTSLDKARDIIASLGRVQERYSGFTYPDIDFMIGTPAETAEEALDTLKWMLDLSLQGPYEAHCHVTTYYPGSVAYSRWAPILDPSSARYFMDLHDQRRVFDRCMKIIRASGDAEIVRHSYYTALMITAAGVQNKDNLGMFIRDELENKFALDLQDIKADTAHLTELYQKSDQYNQFAAITGKRHVF
jgi:radical SAM superfamily enzyme YgiQ (UPF0313 family)